MTKLLALIVTLLLVLPAFAQELTETQKNDIYDALALLQGTTADGFLDEKKIAEVYEDLEAIRTFKPELAKIKHHDARVNAVVISLTDKVLEEILSSLTIEERKIFITSIEKNSYKYSIQLENGKTGIEALNLLNTKFKATLTRLDVYAYNYTINGTLTVGFGPYIDYERAKSFYAEKFTPKAFRARASRERDQVFRMERKGEPVHYAFQTNSFFCYIDCATKQFVFLNVERKDGKILVTEVKPQFLTLWGLPARFNLIPFKNYQDLIAQTQNSDWSIRLHAVSALGMIFSFEGSSYGEDIDSREAARNSQVPQMIKEALQNLDSISKLLAQISTQDNDPEVRDTALHALANREERVKRKEKEKREAEGVNGIDITAPDWWKNLKNNR